MKDTWCITITMERALRDRVRAIAAQEQRSMASQIRQFIKAGIRAPEAAGEAKKKEGRAP